MKKLIMIGLLLFATSALAVDFDGYMHWVKPSTKLTLEWDGDGNGYELYVWRMETGQRYLSGKIVTTKSYTINFKTYGHYIAYVRAYKDIGSTRYWSDWSRSIDLSTAQVDGVPKPWIIYVAPF